MEARYVCPDWCALLGSPLTRQIKQNDFEVGRPVTIPPPEGTEEGPLPTPNATLDLVENNDATMHRAGQIDTRTTEADLEGKQGDNAADGDTIASTSRDRNDSPSLLPVASPALPRYHNWRATLGLKCSSGTSSQEVETFPDGSDTLKHRQQRLARFHDSNAPSIAWPQSRSNTVEFEGQNHPPGSPISSVGTSDERSNTIRYPSSISELEDFEHSTPKAQITKQNEKGVTNVPKRPAARKPRLGLATRSASKTQIHRPDPANEETDELGVRNDLQPLPQRARKMRQNTRCQVQTSRTRTAKQRQDSATAQTNKTKRKTNAQVAWASSVVNGTHEQEGVALSGADSDSDQDELSRPTERLRAKRRRQTEAGNSMDDVVLESVER